MGKPRCGECGAVLPDHHWGCGSRKRVDPNRNRKKEKKK